MGWLVDRLERAGKMTEEELLTCDLEGMDWIEEEEIEEE